MRVVNVVKGNDDVARVVAVIANEPLESVDDDHKILKDWLTCAEFAKLLPVV